MTHYHFTDEAPFCVRTAEGDKLLGKGWMAISEAEYAGLVAPLDGEAVADLLLELGWTTYHRETDSYWYNRDEALVLTDAIIALLPAHPVEPQPVQPDHAKSIMFGYTNYRGEKAVRTAIPQRIYWGSTEWHSDPQWLLVAWDSEREAVREFALADCVFDRATICGELPQPVQEGVVDLRDLVELARRDLLRTSTDFLGRMSQCLGEYQGICDEPDDEWSDATREDADEALSGLIGLALAQLALVRSPDNALAALSATPTPSPASDLREYGDWLPDAWDAYLRELVGHDDARNWARLPATFRWHEFYERLQWVLSKGNADQGEEG